MFFFVHRLCHSHYSEGGVEHAGSHRGGQHAALLPHLQRHVCVHGGFSSLPGQVSDCDICTDSLLKFLFLKFFVFVVSDFCPKLVSCTTPL